MEEHTNQNPEQKEELQQRLRSLQIKFEEKQKSVEKHERELEEAFAEYEQLTKQLAQKQRDILKFKDLHEQLKAEVKLQRIRCKSIECDLLMVQKENETFEKSERELQKKTRDLYVRHCEIKQVTNEKPSTSTQEDLNERTGSSSGSIKELEAIDNIKHLYNDVTSVEASLAEVIAEIAEKNRNFANKSRLNKTSPIPKAKTPPTTSYGLNRRNAISET